MKRSRSAAVVLAAAGIMLATLAIAPRAQAHSSYLTDWRAKYPTTVTNLEARITTATGSACNVCHSPAGSRAATITCYKRDLQSRIAAGRTVVQAINDLDTMDSDGDGVSNGVEIRAARGDGTFGFHPGLIGATGTDPCGASTTAPVTNARETPCRADFDNNGSVSVNDLFAFLAAWFAQNGSAPGTPSADFDASGSVSVNDLFAFLAVWFAQNGTC